MSIVFIENLQDLPKHAHNKSQILLLNFDDCFSQYDSNVRNLFSEIHLYRTKIEKLISGFFEKCEAFDPSYSYGFSSKVLLSIKDYSSLKNFFVLLFFSKLYPERNIYVCSDDPLLSKFVDAALGGSASCNFKRSYLPILQRGGRTLLRSLLSSANKGGHEYVIFSLSHGVAGDKKDSYFSNFFSDKRLNVKRFYLSSGSRIRLPSDGNASPLEAHVKLKDIAVCVYLSLKRQSYKETFLYEGFDLTYIYNTLKFNEHVLGTYYTSLIIERTFERIFSENNVGKLLFPYENRSWEKRLIGKARNAGVKRILGYQHSSLTPRHLSFKQGTQDLNVDNYPDKIITVGDVTADWLKESSPPLSGLVVSGASLRRVTKKIKHSTNRAVLVPISSSRSEASFLMNVVWQASKSCDTEFVIRTHPTILVDDIFESYDWPDTVTLSKGMTLEEDLERTSVIVYSSSTVALEGMLFGRPVIFVDIGDIPSGDPLLDNEKLRPTVVSGSELVFELQAFSALSDKEYGKLQNDLKVYAESYLVSVKKFTRPRLEQLFEIANGR